MLMFENGLLASFIPEFVMVMAYLFCFFVPGLKKNEKQISELHHKVIQTSTSHSNSASVYKSTKHEFSSVNQQIECILSLYTYSEINLEIAFSEYDSRTSTAQKQAYYSRPPPFI